MSCLRIENLFVGLLAFIFIIACGTESGNPPDIQGRVVMGAVSNTTITLYQLDNDGNQTTLLGETTTDSNGSFSFSNLSLSGPMLIIASSGIYEDEATGETVNIPNDFELQTVISEATQYTFAGVNAFTTIAAARIQSNNQVSLDSAIEQAHLEVSQIFGIEGVDLIRTNPDDLTVEGQSLNPENDSTKLGAMIGIFTQIAQDNDLEASDTLSLLENIAADYSDGSLNGTQNGEALPNALSITPLQAMRRLQAATNHFLNGQKNKSGHVGSSFNFQFQEQQE